MSLVTKPQTILLTGSIEFLTFKGGVYVDFIKSGKSKNNLEYLLLKILSGARCVVQLQSMALTHTYICIWFLAPKNEDLRPHRACFVFYSACVYYLADNLC